MKKINSWSFSRFSTYSQCPLKAKLQFLDKIAEPPSSALERGGEIHKEIEDYIRGNVDALVKTKFFKDDIEALKDQYSKFTLRPLIEEMWGFDRDWNLIAWDDWKNCWLRVKLDCAFFEDPTTLVVVDWKTGKYRDSDTLNYIDQLKLYSLAAFIALPHVERVKPQLKYVDQNVIFTGVEDEQELVFQRGQLEELKEYWTAKTQAMLNDKDFAPRPNAFCKWCFYRRSNKNNGGGQCPF